MSEALNQPDGLTSVSEQDSIALQTTVDVVLDSQDSDIERQESLQLPEGGLAAVVRKRRWEHRTPRRRHHQHKSQRVSSGMLDSLNLASLRRNTSTSFCSVSSTDHGTHFCSISESARSISTSEGTIPNESEAEMSRNASALAGYNSVDEGAVGVTDVTSPLATAVEGDSAPVAQMDSIHSLLSTARDELSPESDEVDAPDSQDGSAPNQAVRQLTLESLRTTSSVTSQDQGCTVVVDVRDDSGYVESDCEGYCVLSTEAPDTDQVPATELPQQATDEPPTLDISSVVDASKEPVVIEDGRYTYSPEAQLGVLRLFSHQSGNGTRQTENLPIPTRIVINKSPFVFGSDASCDVTFERDVYRHICSRHCKIVFSECNALATNLRSSGITPYQVEVVRMHAEATMFVNNVALRSRATLRNGDVLTLGPKKFGVSFTVAFRTREACVALMDQLNSLMLTPSNESRLRRQALTPTQSSGTASLPLVSAENTSRDFDLELHTNVAVFELYYGEPAIEGSLSQDWDGTPSVFSPQADWTMSQPSPSTIRSEYSILGASAFPESRASSRVATPGRDSSTRHSVILGSKGTGGQGTEAFDSPSPYRSLRRNMESCKIVHTDLNSQDYDDDSLTGKLLLSTYTTGLNPDNVDAAEKRPPTNKTRVDYESEMRLNAAKVAKLRSFNRTSVPIVVDSSRSLSSDDESQCLTVAKLRFLGTISATYQTTLQELMPSIDGMLQSYMDQSPTAAMSSLSDYEFLLKRCGESISKENYQHNWVFQLDFFDRDDPLFRRAVYASLRRNEPDKQRLRASVTAAIEQLKRSRVLYIQMRVI
ncbi:forkhead-associated protein, putative [Babesia ovata]|uniref:Forkhead-associated protein, putative n=1 Tax=Babesia ovata TaxID=189622 RepID=A0A2H6KBL3_9APIC|nr:forkhead-associated protein, putative [Babesia ovata]GBE60382.1 forkhead-associated protein, putative [Babesia ovata]